LLRTENCKSVEYPEGNCKLAWDHLIAKYAPKSAPSLLKLKKQFANCKLKDENIKYHPDNYISSLESLRNDMDEICESIDESTKMSDLDFMIHVLNNLPELYDVILDGMETRLMLKKSDPKKLTIEDIRAKLNNRYERIKDRHKGFWKEKDSALMAFVEDDENEIAYFAGFKGNCNKCGKYGHKGVDCRSSNNNDTGHNKSDNLPNSNIKCYYCGSRGHVKPNCELMKAHEEGKGVTGEMAKLAYYEDDVETIDELLAF